MVLVPVMNFRAAIQSLSRADISVGAPLTLAGSAIAFAYPTTGGVTLNHSQFGAYRSTGGSSRKNRKPGDCPFSDPVRI
jgi:hypothetical protein